VRVDCPRVSLSRGSAWVPNAGVSLRGARACWIRGPVDRAETQLRRGRRLAPPPLCPTPVQPRAVRVSPCGLVADWSRVLLADLPVDWIAVLEQEE
jgi:hypothetical protein